MRNLLIPLFLALPLLACDAKGPSKCAMDSDCKSGRNCWCEAAARSDIGECWTTDKKNAGECLSDSDYQERKKSESK